MGTSLALGWLQSANDDLEVIKKIIDDENLTHIVAFHAQQSIEKCFKAVMEYKNLNVPKVHKLQFLIAKIDFNIEIEEEILKVLDELYIDSRYPGNLGLLPYGKPTLSDATQFFKQALNIYLKIENTIKGEKCQK